MSSLLSYHIFSFFISKFFENFKSGRNFSKFTAGLCYRLLPVSVKIGGNRRLPIGKENTGAILVIPLAVIFEKLALQSPRILSCVLLLSCCVNCQPPYTLDKSKKKMHSIVFFFSYENCKSWSLLPNITNHYSLYSYYQQNKMYCCSYLYYFDLNMLC